jgi:hypothetical protein
MIYADRRRGTLVDDGVVERPVVRERERDFV